MKLHIDRNPSQNAVTAYGTGFIEVNRQRHTTAVLVQPEGEVIEWTAEAFETLERAHFEAILRHAPELVLLGTGSRQRFPHPSLMTALTEARVGVEIMDTGAACRTYNILMSEGRRVLAALLPG